MITINLSPIAKDLVKEGIEIGKGQFELGKEMMAQALKLSGGNIAQAGLILGLTPACVMSKIAIYGMVGLPEKIRVQAAGQKHFKFAGKSA